MVPEEKKSVVIFVITLTVRGVDFVLHEILMAVTKNHGDRESRHSAAVIPEVVGRGRCSSCGCRSGCLFVDNVYVGGSGQGRGTLVYRCDCKSRNRAVIQVPRWGG